MSDQTLSPPKFAVGQKVFAVRLERMRHDSSHPIVIAEIASVSTWFHNLRLYTLAGTDPTLTFFEHELHSDRNSAAHAVCISFDAYIERLETELDRAGAYIAANT